MNDQLRVFKIPILILSIVLMVFLAAQTAVSLKEFSRIGKAEPIRNELIVEGQSRVRMTPDLANINVSIESKAQSVAEAQTKNTEKANALIGTLKGLGVADEDIQTSYYNAYEEQQWNQDTQRYVSVGWIVYQTLEIHIRDLEKVAQVLTAAGQANVSNINGPNFTIEDPNKYRDEAREQALANARDNKEKLEQSLGLKLKKVVGYDEYIGGGGGPIPYAFDRAVMAEGIGGAAPEPSIEVGTEEIIFNVTIRYEIED